MLIPAAAFRTTGCDCLDFFSFFLRLEDFGTNKGNFSFHFFFIQSTQFKLVNMQNKIFNRLFLYIFLKFFPPKVFSSPPEKTFDCKMLQRV